MNSDIFLAWLKEFVRHGHPLPDNRALLIADGYSSHQDLQVIIFARNNNVDV
jgi:hypothetical protein